ncbi:Holliday junction branch migration protein RuvA [Planctomonas psychrotolerans]|uniref:Holliday junction branch migration protein RuvA n=1 Tax=Planctomonas psychrotolerans TaxID=2528712 RepID=UPI0012399EFE|nr:Holliday junction branch migration protein RuvA [Planctomonas psychrotolerans]
MISSLRGTVLVASGSTVVLEVGGVGYSVQVTPAHASSLSEGQEAMLLTSLIVREDSLSLFGFAGADELRVFDLLCGVTGVGPKSALGVLASVDPASIAAAVATEDDAVFRRVSGIGPKTAKLIVLQLAGKIVVSAPVRAAAPAPTPSNGGNVVAALVGLGWSERVATQTIDEILAEDDTDPSTAVLLRLALARLGPQQAVGGAR